MPQGKSSAKALRGGAQDRLLRARSAQATKIDLQGLADPRY